MPAIWEAFHKAKVRALEIVGIYITEARHVARSRETKEEAAGQLHFYPTFDKCQRMARTACGGYTRQVTPVPCTFASDDDFCRHLGEDMDDVNKKVAVTFHHLDAVFPTAHLSRFGVIKGSCPSRHEVKLMPDAQCPQQWGMM